MTRLTHLLVGGWTRRSTWSGLLYLLLGFITGLVTIVIVSTGFATGLGLLILVVGLALMWASMAASLVAARLDARMGRFLTGAELPIPPPVPSLSDEPVLKAMGRLSISGQAWRSVLWHWLRTLVGGIALTVIVVLLVAGAGLFVQPIWGSLYDAAIAVRVISLIGSAASFALIPYVVEGLMALLRGSSRPLLGPSRRSQLKEATARTATAEARVDLARDLHDSVGHSVTAAVLQASAARRRLADDPEFADKALEAIEERGRAALEELDRVLAVIRDEGATERRDEGLDLVDEVVATARAAGQPIELTRRGAMDDVPPAVGREAYRVIQETVTNTMRHAAGAATTVSLVSENGLLVIDVANAAGERLSPERTAGGTGLVGVAERARAFGGTVTSGPTDDGGFRVHVELPFGRSNE